MQTWEWGRKREKEGAREEGGGRQRPAVAIKRPWGLPRSPLPLQDCSLERERERGKRKRKKKDKAPERPSAGHHGHQMAETQSAASRAQNKDEILYFMLFFFINAMHSKAGKPIIGFTIHHYFF